MAIITLTTDFGLKDNSVGVTKGAIYSELIDAKIVDISHNVTPFDIAEAAYIIKNSYHCFPKGSIHIIGIDSEYHIENKHIAVQLDDHYFICANNGILSMLCNEIVPSKIIEINIHDKKHSSFATLDIFVKVACHIARGGNLDLLGSPLKTIKHLTNITPTITKDKIFGSVIYIDNYGNVVTNITKAIFNANQKGRAFEINARNTIFKKINSRYSDIINFNTENHLRNNDGKGFAIFNSANCLEICIYKSNPKSYGGASSLMSLNMRDSIFITFINENL